MVIAELVMCLHEAAGNKEARSDAKPEGRGAYALKDEPGKTEQAVVRLTPENVKHTVVVLREKDGGRRLPIFIGKHEGDAIGHALRGVELPRPMTHDLLCATVEAMGGRPRRVVVTALRDCTFHGALHIEMKDKDLELDCRPSDGIAVAARTGIPVFCEEAVLEEAACESHEQMQGPRAIIWREGGEER
jgi:bifunctional DNase/RNase